MDCLPATARNSFVRCGEFERFGFGTESRLEMMRRVLIATLARAPWQRLQTRLFRVPAGSIDTLNWAGIALYKLAIVMFNLVHLAVASCQAPTTVGHPGRPQDSWAYILVPPR